ncbi:MAG: CoA transferase [Acidimicrobiales bacterium]
MAHPQGSAVESLPRVLVGDGEDSLRWQPDKTRPLAGLQVLDLTRVLAGPTCGKYLAALGANVTNIRSEHVPVVPSFVLETGVGKTVLSADLRDAVDRHAVRELGASRRHRAGVPARHCGTVRPRS